MKVLLVCILASILLLSGCTNDAKKSWLNDKPITQQDLNGNLFSGGYVAEHSGYIYFANQEDENKLYQMNINGKNKIKLSDETNASPRLEIQIKNKKLFYLQNSEIGKYLAYTLYSYDLIQNSETKLSDKNICSYTFYQDFIYFTTKELQDNDESPASVYCLSKLFKMKSDGSDIKLMSDDYFDFAFAQITDDKLYIGHHESVLKNTLEGVSEKSWYAVPHLFVVYNKELYYMPYNETKLYKTSIDSELEGVEIIDKDVDFFTIYQNIIYFSTHDKKIYKADLDGNNQEFIVAGTAPIVLSETLFFYNKNDKIDSIPR